MLRPLKNSILFAFLDDRNNRGIISKTRSGIQLVASLSDQHEPRWGQVLAVGPTVDESIVVGEYILVEPLMWTNMMKVDDVDVWKTDDTKVIATSVEPLNEI